MLAELSILFPIHNEASATRNRFFTCFQPDTWMESSYFQDACDKQRSQYLSSI